MFNDDWAAATHLYDSNTSRPPITLLVMCVGETIIFDATREELAVADYVLAVSVCKRDGPELSVLSMRAIDPPARFTNPGVPDAMNAVTGGTAPTSKAEALAMRELGDAKSVWRLPRGGVKRTLIARMVKEVVKSGGVGEEVLDALQGFETR